MVFCPESLAAGVISGDIAALGRTITLVESTSPAHRPLAREVLTLLAGGGERQTRRVAVSGPPGAGKSTFIEALGNHLCTLGMKVAVLAVDPSSSLTGGSILGDKTRMETLSKRPDCFIRPSPSGGSLGGVTRRTRESIRVCEAAGFDVILVETVGVGQSEIAVRSMVDCFLLLIIAGAGDELQGIKKGIVEIADLLLVNKADGENRARAELTRSSFANVIPILCPDTHGWIPPVLAISAAEHIGISNCWQQIEGYFAHLTNTDQLEPRRRRQALDWCRAHVAGELYSRFQEDPEIASETVRIEKAILEGVMEPSLAAETLLEYLRPPKQA